MTTTTKLHASVLLLKIDHLIRSKIWVTASALSHYEVKTRSELYVTASDSFFCSAFAPEGTSVQHFVPRKVDFGKLKGI